MEGTRGPGKLCPLRRHLGVVPDATVPAPNHSFAARTQPTRARAPLPRVKAPEPQFLLLNTTSVTSIKQENYKTGERGGGSRGRGRNTLVKLGTFAPPCDPVGATSLSLCLQRLAKARVRFRPDSKLTLGGVVGVLLLYQRELWTPAPAAVRRGSSNPALILGTDMGPGSFPTPEVFKDKQHDQQHDPHQLGSLT